MAKPLAYSKNLDMENAVSTFLFYGPNAWADYQAYKDYNEHHPSGNFWSKWKVLETAVVPPDVSPLELNFCVLAEAPVTFCLSTAPTESKYRKMLALMLLKAGVKSVHFYASKCLTNGFEAFFTGDFNKNGHYHECYEDR